MTMKFHRLPCPDCKKARVFEFLQASDGTSEFLSRCVNEACDFSEFLSTSDVEDALNDSAFAASVAITARA